jgi:hypothetical protein
MGQYFRRDYSKGWVPSADAVNCPKNSLLRMDNCILDEQGVVSARPGSALLYTLGTDVHSLATMYLGTTKYRLQG